MTLYRLIYASRPFGFDAATLGGILIGAQRNNARDGITGALICRADLYLQLIEGPRDAIDAAFARIGRDDRHLDVEELWTGGGTDRMFPAWAMLDDPARSWLWSPAEVARGAIGAAPPEAIVGVFARLAAEGPAGSDPGFAGLPAACPARANA